LDQELLLIEEEIDVIFNKKLGNIFCVEDNMNLESLESRKNHILLLKEEERRLKSKAICIKSDDNNSWFFHIFANQRRISNSIWDL